MTALSFMQGAEKVILAPIGLGINSDVSLTPVEQRALHFAAAEVERPQPDECCCLDRECSLDSRSTGETLNCRFESRLATAIVQVSVLVQNVGEQFCRAGRLEPGTKSTASDFMKHARQQFEAP